MMRLALSLSLLVACGCSEPTASTDDSSKAMIAATVVSYETNAEWDHMENGAFAARDILTLELDAPVHGSKKTLAVSLLPTDLAEDSPFRKPGTRLTFVLDESIDDDIHLAWGALKNPTVVK
jgi:hypothetical protein